MEKVTQGHGRGSVPGAVLEALNGVFGEPKGLRGVGKARQPELELGLRQVHVELFPEAGAPGSGGERSRSVAQLGLGVVAAAVERCEDGPLDGQACRVERVPRARGAWQGRCQVAGLLRYGRSPDRRAGV